MSALKVLFFGCLFATQAVALIPDSDQHELVLSVPSKDSEPISYGSLCNELSILPLIRVALDNYSDNLDMAARYIADHLQYKGYFLVHSQKLDCLRRSTSGCYFHDNRIYVLIVKYQNFSCDLHYDYRVLIHNKNMNDSLFEVNAKSSKNAAKRTARVVVGGNEV
ncbi:hypothetical protein QR680_009921 [Steinernema hermaphroditum]|uniref:Uncharacterized protein n=1 Tax=Steinernema hermaphroditum TaxID=289476 RepID=A0AA39IM43_9BILA|nr:hypothetical protein QR680_009921 [Steinernema hermaphroditum]